MMRSKDYRSYMANTWPFMLINGFFCVIISMVWLDLAANDFVHSLYDGTSIFFVFLASLLVLIMAAQRSVALQILSVLLTGFYTQRVVMTYFYPDYFDYNDYVGFNTQNIQDASIFYFLCVLSILFGAVILRPFLAGFFSCRRHTADVDAQSIRYVSISVDFAKLCLTAIRVIIIAYIYKFSIMATGFGLTGTIYGFDETVLKWSLGIGDALSPFVLFSWIYFPDSSREKRLAKAALVLVVLDGLAMTSKGFLLSLMVSYYLIMRLTGRKFPAKFFIYSVLLVILSIFVIFPMMTIFRSALLSESLTFDMSRYGVMLYDAFQSFSSRLGGFDWMTLWLTVPRSEIPASATAWSELIQMINRLVPGEIIAQPDAVNLAKLQVVLGRGWGELSTLGGHGENTGGLAAAYIFFGKTIALVYLTVWGGAITVLEHFRIHPFHKVTILFSYLIIFMIGGGFVLMHGAFYWYLVFTTFLVIVLKVYATVAVHGTTKTRRITDR